MSRKDLTPAPHYKKSTRSGNQGDACVEVATNVPGAVYVRDSKDPRGPELWVDATDWDAFIDSVKRP